MPLNVRIPSHLSIPRHKNRPVLNQGLLNFASRQKKGHIDMAVSANRASHQNLMGDYHFDMWLLYGYPARPGYPYGPVFRSNYNPRPDNINLRGNHGIPLATCAFVPWHCASVPGMRTWPSQVWQFGTTGVGP